MGSRLVGCELSLLSAIQFSPIFYTYSVLRVFLFPCFSMVHIVREPSLSSAVVYYTTSSRGSVSDMLLARRTQSKDDFGEGNHSSPNRHGNIPLRCLVICRLFKGNILRSRFGDKAWLPMCKRCIWQVARRRDIFHLEIETLTDEMRVQMKQSTYISI